MKIVTSPVILLLLIASSFIGFISCEKNDEVENDTIDEYYSMLYGNWYMETNSELSKTFMSYTFSTNKQLIRYTKSAQRSKYTMNGNVSYSEWEVTSEYFSYGTWYLERDALDRILLKIKWDGNNSFVGYPIDYLDSKTLGLSDGYDSDLYKGEKTPDF